MGILIDLFQIKISGSGGTLGDGRKTGKGELAKRLTVTQGTPPPKYQDGNAAQCCGTCSYVDGSQCTKFNVAIELGKVCDAWAANPVKRDDSTGGRMILQAPKADDGRAPMDSNFRADAPH